MKKAGLKFGTMHQQPEKSDGKLTVVQINPEAKTVGTTA